MPTLTIHTETGAQRFTFAPGPSLRQILDVADVRVRSGCRGVGACGLCLVRIEAGEAGAPGPNERLHLDAAQLAGGLRLACQVLPEHDLELVILAPAPKSAWKCLDRAGRLGMARDWEAGVLNLWGRNPEHAQPVGDSDAGATALPMRDLPQGIPKPYGVAVDLGTTHISLALHDLSSGRWLAGCQGPNPQTAYGADIMTRLVAAAESPEQAQALSQSVVAAIGEALWEMAVREGLNLRQVALLTLVGNTALLALLSKRNVDLLLQPQHWTSAIDCRPTDTAAWATAWDIHPEARIDVIPPLAGFVGSDLLAGVSATNLTEGEAGSLLIDFGTNSEIALWDGTTLWCTSAAGGPAFEGSGMRCGMPAEPGAIYRVNLQDGALDYAVIGGGEPRGLCASGIVDLLAGLIRTGQLTGMGKFAPAVPRAEFTFGRGERRLVFSSSDVDVFQRAKAAIGVGIHVLLDRARLAENDLRRVCIGGAFGYALDVLNAQAIGLLPGICPEDKLVGRVDNPSYIAIRWGAARGMRNCPARVELWGNTALAGCEAALLSPAVTLQMTRLRDQARVINLSGCSDFAELFLEHLYLRP